MKENKEIPPTPEPPLVSEIETSWGQAEKEVEKPETAKVSPEPTEVVEAGPSGKAEKTEEATKDASQAKSKGIFTGCGSFEKL